MDTPEDYQRLGVNPERIEKWEDGIRIKGAEGEWEWWYFDCILDDGSAAIIQFFSKGYRDLTGDVLKPFGTIKLTESDGTSHVRLFEIPAQECRFSNETCDVHIGKHIFSGDLTDYRILVDPIDGLGADLHLHSLAQPYRPGTAYLGFGEKDEKIFTWLCAVSKGEVCGTLTVNGQTRQVKGSSYHDHQWGNNLYLSLFNHWTWARQRYDDYTVVLFDMMAAEPYGYQRFPFFFIQDAQGKLVFSNTHGVNYEVLENYDDEATGKDYPKSGRYRFHHDGKDFEYTLTWNQELETGYVVRNLPLADLAELSKTHPKHNDTYKLYLTTGTLQIRDGGQTIERSDSLIYEFMYSGADYRSHV